jgi:hypothetical protein
MKHTSTGGGRSGGALFNSGFKSLRFVMEDKPEDKIAGWGRTIAWTAGVVVVLFVLYVLSCGPVIALTLRFGEHGQHPGWVGVFYAPLRWLYDNTAIRQPLDDYVEWWIRLVGR